MIRRLLAILFVITSVTPTPGAEPEATPRILPPPSNAPRFTTVDVTIDSHDHPLAAYQVEITTPEHVTLVGIEGAATGPFAKAPPYYDPAALGHGRIVLAAFSTDANLPRGTSRVARIHVMIEGMPDGPIRYATKLAVAADAGGTAIDGAAVAVR